MPRPDESHPGTHIDFFKCKKNKILAFGALKKKILNLPFKLYDQVFICFSRNSFKKY